MEKAETLLIDCQEELQTKPLDSENRVNAIYSEDGKWVDTVEEVKNAFLN